MVTIGKWSLVEDGEDLKLLHLDDLTGEQKVHETWKPSLKGTPPPNTFGTRYLDSVGSSSEDHGEEASPKE